MIDMSTWESTQVNVLDEVRLDPNNVRLGLKADPSESDIIDDLFRNEKAMELVESIAQVGFLTHELPIVVRRGSQLIVVEGNRRLAALKAIQNPLLVPDYKARVQRLVDGMTERNSLNRISVLIAPNQDAANELIATLHTGSQRRRWGPERQAAFFEAQIEAGKTVAELVERYPTAKVGKFVLRFGALRLFRAVEYEDPELKDFVSSRKFPVSTLERLYENPEFRELVGIAFNAADGQVQLTSSGRDFNLLAETIISDIRNNNLTTRTLNKSSDESYKSYFHKLRSILDTGRSSAPGVGSTLTGSNIPFPANVSKARQQVSGTSADSPRALKPTSITRKNLDTSQIIVSPTLPAPINALILELTHLDIEQFPNAALDLLRTTLEKSIKAYASRHNLVIPKKGRYVTLADCLSWIEKQMESQASTQRFVQVARKLGAQSYFGGYLISQDYLNAINHNHEIGASVNEVREAWDAMKGLLQEVLKP